MELYQEEQKPEYFVLRYEGTTYRFHQEGASPYDVTKLHRFFCVAESIATLSRDPSTRVGALIFGPGYEIRSSGWNGAPRGCSADEDDRYSKREEKLFWSSHAEMNAIVNAARVGVKTEGSALLATHMPCMGCAKAIVQAGITDVICPDPDELFAFRWGDDIVRTKALFKECGVRLITFTEDEK